VAVAARRALRAHAVAAAGPPAALCEAAAGADDVERRPRGSDVRWSRDWDTSFGDELLTRVLSLLER
jgi:hypothetical protein